MRKGPPIAVGVAALAGIGLFAALRDGPAPRPLRDGPPPAADAVVRFESEPPGAEVLGPDGPLGTTPFSRAFPGARPESVVFRLPGHYPRQRRVGRDDAVVHARLLPK